MESNGNSSATPIRLNVEDLPVKVREMRISESMLRAGMPPNYPSGIAQPPTAPPTPPPTIPQTSSLESVLTAFKALGFALSARALLFLALIGAFVLAVMAMLAQSYGALAVFIAYGILAVGPVTFLEIKRRAG